MTSGTQVELRVTDSVLEVDGLDESRQAGLFFRGVLGGTRVDNTWRIEPTSRSLDELCVTVNRWLNRRGYETMLTGIVDVSVERDAERQRGFERAREAGALFRTGEVRFSRDNFVGLLRNGGWDLGGRQLREHQIVAALQALTTSNAANFSVPGAGKTAATLAVAAAQVAAGNIDLVIVVGPLSCFQPWETEAGICLPSWTVTRISGTAADRRRAIRAARDRTFLLVSYPGAVSDNAALKDLARQKRVMLVADESHRIKRFRGGLWAPAVVDLAKLAVSRIVLSGTPMPQSGLDLYSQLNVMWPGKELTGSRDQFKPRVERQFDRVIAEVRPFVSRTSKDELGLRPPEVISHNVELTPPESEIYRLLRNHLRQAVQAADPTETDRLAALRRGRPVRLLQAATNPGLLAARHRQPLSAATTPTILRRIADFDQSGAMPAKFEFAGGIVDTLGGSEKVVVWSNYIRNLDLFAAFIKATRDISVFQVDGRVAARTSDVSQVAEFDDDSLEASREDIIEKFLSCDGRAVLITNPASCSESISLHRSCRTAIYLDRTYDCAQWLQSIDRIHRLGLPADAVVRVHVLNALADGAMTADGLVAASLESKSARMSQLLEGASLEPLGEESDAADGSEADMKQLLAYLMGRDG